MNLYEYIESIQEYFYSVRLHQQVILVDIKFPVGWTIKEILALQPTKTQVKENDKSQEFQLISFYCPFEKEQVKNLIQDINRVIKYNKDQEEKINLLNLKRVELEKIFQSNDVNSLRELEFSFGVNPNSEPTLEKLSKEDEKK